MRRAFPRAVLLFAASLIAACSDGSSSSPDSSGGTPTSPQQPAAPALVSPNGAVPVVAGSEVAYDASRAGTAFSDPAGRGLTYTAAIEGAANGLSVTGGCHLAGRPAEPGVTWVTVTATDALGRTAQDRFAVVAFRPGLGAPTLPPVMDRYDDASVPIPQHFRAVIGPTSVVSTDNTPADNPITNAGATLGRVLFYDPRLSANDGVSCSSCHAQALGFGDAPALSTGFAGGLTHRHSMGLSNARYYRPGRFFWDERAATLEVQVLTPVQDATEMGMTLDRLTQKLTATSYYPALFAQAFGTREVTSDRVARALAQYVRALSSSGSRYDRAFAAGGPPDFSGFTAQERQGEQLFRATGCAACHSTVAQVSDAVHNTGLDAVDTDAGAGNGQFKAPSLRNVAARPRFMHDGRFTSLDQVVAFYDTGVQPNPSLDRRLRAPDGSPRRLNLTAGDRSALVAFLRTLTDSAFLTAARFSSPFPAAPAGPAAVTMQGTAFHPATLTVAPARR